MTALPWFRLYSEFAHDPKVQTMSESMQRRLIMLFCLRCSDQLKNLSEKEIAYALKLSVKEWRKTRETFVLKGFLNEEGSLKNFDERQFTSDHSHSRVKKSRNSSKNAVVEESCNGFVTEENCYSNGNVTVQNRIDKIRIDKIRKDNINNIRSEGEKPPSDLSQVQTKNFISLHLVDKTEFDVSEEVVREFENCYPAVNVREQLRKMRAYFFASPQKRKTRKGIMKSINSWLSKHQDSGRNNLSQSFPPRMLNNVQHNQLVLEKIHREEDEKKLLLENNGVDIERSREDELKRLEEVMNEVRSYG